MGVPEDAKDTKELITRFQALSRLESNPLLLCGIMGYRRGATVELRTLPARVCVVSKGDASLKTDDVMQKDALTPSNWLVLLADREVARS